MIDLVCALAVVGVVLLSAMAFGVRVALRGRPRFDRVDREGTSALLGRTPMDMAHFALEPIGVRLAGAGVSADLVTLGSLVVGFVAAGLLVQGFDGAGALGLAIAASMDALDGIVARHAGTADARGEVLDATVDRYVELLALGAIAIRHRDSTVMLATAIAALGASMMVSYTTAKCEAMGVVAPRGSMRRAERLAYLLAGLVMSALLAAVGKPASATHAPVLAALALIAIVGNASAIVRSVTLARAVGKSTPPKGES